jgi:membrane-bound serine protease (ClpP class)
MTLIVLLAVIGMALIIAELVLPGGIVGIAGAICLIGAVVLTFVKFGATAGAIALVAVLIFGILILVLWAKYLHRLPLANKIVQQKTISDPAAKKQLADLVGRQGETLTKLSPSGHAQFGQDKLDVISESGVIEKGKKIRIVGTRGPSILVEEI